VDFLHQFCRSAVSKEDKTLLGRRSGYRFAGRQGFAEGIFHKAGIPSAGKKCAGFDSPRGF
jgi:hypothetical protein